MSSLKLMNVLICSTKQLFKSKSKLPSKITLYNKVYCFYCLFLKSIFANFYIIMIIINQPFFYKFCTKTNKSSIQHVQQDKYKF